MTDRITNLEAYTHEELEQNLAHVLAHARGEVLNDTERREVQQINLEVQRRHASSVAAVHSIVLGTIIDSPVQTKCPTCGRPCGADELSECLRCGQLYCSNDSWNCGCDTDAREIKDRAHQP